VVQTVPALLECAEQAEPGDFLIIDCSHLQPEHLERCAAVVRQTAVPVHLITHSEDLIHAMEGISLGPIIWFRAPFEELVSLMTTLRLLKLNATQELLRPQYSLLSPRQQQVAALVAKGCSECEIADALEISLGTVKSHVNRTRVKLNCYTVEELRTTCSRMTGSPGYVKGIDH
jgi:DNA-binding NarL/FixJ family response regulator